MEERRKVPRQKSLLRARAFFNNRRSAVDCLIRDISTHGARLVFSGTVSIPDAIDLYIPQKEETFRARVHWRHGDEMGVGFVDAAEHAPLPTQPADAEDIAVRVRKLEAEVTEMRHMLKYLKAAVTKSNEAA
jgi:hypothetical protein